jgi:hypothetical protein
MRRSSFSQGFIAKLSNMQDGILTKASSGCDRDECLSGLLIAAAGVQRAATWLLSDPTASHDRGAEETKCRI